MQRTFNSSSVGYRRRGATAVMVAVFVPVLVGFAALTIDVGLIYNTKTDLQSAADAAALAAASRLGDFDAGDPMTLGRQAAEAITQNNNVLNQQVQIDASDITFGRATFDKATGQLTFVPTNIFPDAARVVIRKSSGSPNGAVGLFFARIFGKNTQDVTAEAIAMLMPRDIAVVADLSRSHNYDSTLRYYKSADVNLYDIWANFPGGIEDVNTLWTEDANVLTLDELAQRAGPAWGLFRRLGYGVQETPSSYDPNTDPGLIQLAYGVNSSDVELRGFLTDRGYSASEVTAIMSGNQDSDADRYTDRVAVALGLAVWKSGMPGGLWQQLGTAFGAPGNANATVGSSELVWVEQFGNRSVADSANIWRDYIRNYVRSSNSNMAKGNSDFQYQFGVKTFVDYLLNKRAANALTPELANTPHYPMQAVKDSVAYLAQTIENLKSNDRLSLEIYATTGRHEVDLTRNYDDVSNRLAEMQAGHYESMTNIGAGILRGIETLTGAGSNPAARKVMIVLTDGNANIGCETCTGYDPTAGAQYARTMAEAAADAGIQIFSVSVGSGADRILMDDIASLSKGTYFRAEGTVAQYSDQLDAIFGEIGGSQQVMLIK
ncbi:MAG: VWA domain-containing protein [Planctomycetes bacterium]|nr:VWA domain-containing protein [Planctomycetota bacterium]